MRITLNSEHHNLKCSHFVGIGVTVFHTMPCSPLDVTLRMKYGITRDLNYYLIAADPHQKPLCLSIILIPYYLSKNKVKLSLCLTN
jgi:hypothetical protein